MASLSVELGWVYVVKGEPIFGPCVRQETLAISGSTATLATAVTAAEAAQEGGGSDFIVRLATDTDCYIAIGTTPDPTATAQTSATNARRFLSAGSYLPLSITVGQKVAVHT